MSKKKRNKQNKNNVNEPGSSFKKPVTVPDNDLSQETFNNEFLRATAKLSDAIMSFVERKVDKSHLYVRFITENNEIGFTYSVFFQKTNQFYFPHEINERLPELQVNDHRINQLHTYVTNEITDLIHVCQKYNEPVPTELWVDANMDNQQVTHKKEYSAPNDSIEKAIENYKWRLHATIAPELEMNLDNLGVELK